MFTLVAGTTDPAETLKLGAALAATLRRGDLLVLAGDLGAGKTKLVQGIGRGLGVAEPITSPTFALANRYDTERADGSFLHHLDVYRLNVVGEVIDLDLPDLLDSGITTIEWGEQIEEVLPPDHLLVALEYLDVDDLDDNAGSEAVDNHRRLRFTGIGPQWADRAPQLRAAMSPWLDDDDDDQSRA